jgi:hypothetical protein
VRLTAAAAIRPERPLIADCIGDFLPKPGRFRQQFVDSADQRLDPRIRGKIVGHVPGPHASRSPCVAFGSKVPVQ